MYRNGYEMWQELVIRFGLEEAKGIAERYITMQRKSKPHDREEMAFCDELDGAKNHAVAQPA